MSGEKKDLTAEGKSGIILTDDEERIITNLRHYGPMYPNADVAALLTFHHGKLSKGLLCVGLGDKSSNLKL